MWWEVIPSGCIIAVCMATPQFAAWYYNQAVFGNSFRRKLDSMYERNMFLRDSRVSGAPWVIKGLESIPDN